MLNQHTLWAVFSSKQAAVSGVTRYFTPDGRVVATTEVSETPGCPLCPWDDKIDVGPVHHEAA